MHRRESDRASGQAAAISASPAPTRERKVTMGTRNVAVIVGSLRKESLNRKMANALIRLAPAELALKIVEIGALPLFNQDNEANPTPAVTEFKEAIAKSDAVLFVTPEYNRSMPGGLKNAIDVGSRPSGKGVWSHKPAAVISVTPGALGAMAANQALRQTLAGVNVATGVLTELQPNPPPATGTFPNYIAIHPNGLFLFTADQGPGALSRFPINGDGTLAPATVIPNTGAGTNAMGITKF